MSASLDHDATDRQIVDAAREAASGLRAMHGRALLDRLLERMLPQGRGEVGVPATQRALHAEAVDLLLLSPQFLETDAPVAENAVHAALAQGADVEVLSGEAAAHLDRAAGGIAARLRFAIDGSPRPDTGRDDRPDTLS
ncbi:eRF1 domain 3 protein (plasmid) [Gemmatirosa kalamazoonensis]|uniref:ERF1 domain 3 protein n=1 Tax=Gemmatirosa kalamazoonensis TaxID=861299 RepID=W0RQS7_9BACT|nr:eRF1 domain 3 protein [Gemmatirosa kalamazoonensis]